MQADDCAFEMQTWTAVTVDLYRRAACHIAILLFIFACLLALSRILY